MAFDRHTDAKQWTPGEVDLSRFAGREILLRLESHPGLFMRNLADYLAESRARLGEYLGAVAVSDGIVHAGERRGAPFSLRAFLEERLAAGWPDAQELADAILEHAVALEDGRPRDDASVVVVTIAPTVEQAVAVRRLTARLPVD